MSILNRTQQHLGHDTARLNAVTASSSGPGVHLVTEFHRVLLLSLSMRAHCTAQYCTVLNTGLHIMVLGIFCQHLDKRSGFSCSFRVQSSSFSRHVGCAVVLIMQAVLRRSRRPIGRSVTSCGN